MAKRMFWIPAFAGMTLMIGCFTGMTMMIGCAFADENSIGHLFDEKIPVKVHVGEVTNESDQGDISADDFKKSLEESLNNRKAIDFDTVNVPAEADIKIDAIIKKYQYLERGPFNPNPGIATTLVDAAATATSNYVEMEVRYIITDIETGKVLWMDDIKEYVKKTMTPKESIATIYDKITRVFISRSFGGAHKNSSVKPPM